MTDRITPEHRSWNMSRISGKNTKPEIVVRSLVHSLGLRFRLHCSALPGRPDLVFRRHNTVLFVHGCFWHRHEGCRFAYTPNTRKEFWARKFHGNVARDATVQKLLRAAGWRVITVWECETRRPDRLAGRLSKLFKVKRF
jgi:DNA mismatch endonuclease (patch repair protein)